MTIYLDHNATTQIRPEVFEAIMPYLKEEYGNASSVHQVGQRARKAIEDARVQLASFIGAEDPNEIIFTSGGTESNNTAIKGVLECHHGKGRRMVSSAIEHSSIRHVLRYLSDNGKIDNVVVPVQPNGRLRPEDVAEAVTPDTLLVSVMTANNETGVIQPIAEISALLREKNVLFHTDAVQAAGKINLNVKELGVDLLTLSGHKIGAPKGVGILYVKKGTRLYSLIHGGSQEKNRRGGTENVAAIVGFGVAAKLARIQLKEEKEKLSQLRDKLENNLLAAISHAFVNGDRLNRTFNTTNIGFDYVDSSALVMALDLKGIAVSNGSACASGNPDPSHVLLAMGLTQDKAHVSIRFSLGNSTTEEEITHVCKIVPEVVARLRETHPLWKEAV